MRRFLPRLLVLVLFCALAFWGGVQWERRNCKVDLPNSVGQVDNSVVCKEFRSDLPPVPNPTIAP